MKKITYFSLAVLATSIIACTKDNDGLKEQIEKTLPVIEITSMGLPSQTGPFLTKDTLQVTFGGAITNNEAGVFDIAWYTAPTTGSGTRIDSIHFANWNEVATITNDGNSIATAFNGSTYPNTNTFSGNLVLKLNRLAAGNKSYTLRLYARTKDSKLATVSVSRFITMK